MTRTPPTGLFGITAKVWKGGGLAGVVASAAALGWVGALVLIATALAVLAAGCWILNNTARTRRLTDVIAAWKTPPTQRS